MTDAEFDAMADEVLRRQDVAIFEMGKLAGFLEALADRIETLHDDVMRASGGMTRAEAVDMDRNWMDLQARMRQ